MKYVSNLEGLIEFECIGRANIYAQLKSNEWYFHYYKLNLSLIDSNLFNCEFQLFVAVL